MTNIEIPLGKRSRKYRFFEILPGVLSYGAIFLLVILSLFNPLLAAIYLLIVILTVFVKSVGIAVRTIQGYNRLKKAQRVNWQRRLEDLETPDIIVHDSGWDSSRHARNLELISNDDRSYLKPKAVYNAVIIATYNEGLEVLEPTLQSVVATTFPNDRIILVIAYEGRAGAETEKTVETLKKKYGKNFFAFHTVKHPVLPNELLGKGGNITYAGKFLAKWIKKEGIASDNVIITTLDSDNRPHKQYFSAVTYEFITRPNRQHLSFQPISLFLNNIWDAPAPMRVIATGNSFWNIIVSMRPHALRNFASHSQPLKALEGMNFWSVRTVVEDGHQYWRSYFFFNGNYSVLPIYIPIYQDAVLSETYKKTIKAQFIQLRRWAYGVSDIPYIAVRLFTKNRKVPFWSGFAHFFRLLDSHISWSSMPILVSLGGWVPLLLNQEAARSIVAHELPEVISTIQRVAMIGIFITVFLAFKMLPPRPQRYKRHRTFFMAVQWLLMPITSIAYSSLAAYNSQTRLMLGKYLDKFDSTDKAVKSHARK